MSIPVVALRNCVLGIVLLQPQLTDEEMVQQFSFNIMWHYALNVSDALKKLFDFDPSKQRLDSVHIFSNMAYLGRIRLFIHIIQEFLVNLKRHQAGLYQALGDVAIRYEEKNDGQFAVKPSESSRTLQECVTIGRRWWVNFQCRLTLA